MDWLQGVSKDKSHQLLLALQDQETDWKVGLFLVSAIVVCIEYKFHNCEKDS